MKKKTLYSFIALAALAISNFTVTAQTVNMSRYITLTVQQQGEQVRLNLTADSDSTDIKVVSGGNEQILNIGTAWTNWMEFTAGATTMTIYGNVRSINCSPSTTTTKILAMDLSNNTELTYLSCANNLLTSLDVSSLTKLEFFSCFGNNFTTQTLDDLYCSLAAVTKPGRIFPLRNTSDVRSDIVLPTNKQNAKNKNWSVLYFDDKTEIPTTGNYSCPITSLGQIEQIATTAHLYPYSGGNELYIASEHKLLSVSLYDVFGSQVLSYTTSSINEITIDMSTLQNNIYIVKLNTVKGVETHKIIKK